MQTTIGGRGLKTAAAAFMLVIFTFAADVFLYRYADPAARLESKTFYTGDAGEYLFMGQYLASSGRLLGLSLLTPELQKKGYFIEGDLNHTRGPLYPTFLAAVMLSSGVDLRDDATTQRSAAVPIILAQLFLHLLLTVTLFSTAIRLGLGPWASVLIAILVAFEPNVLSSFVSVQAEALLLPIVAAMMLAATYRPIAFAALAAASALVKPVGAVLALVAAIALTLARARQRISTRQLALGAVAMFLIIAPYSIRNLIEFGDPRLSTQFGYNFATYNLRTVIFDDGRIAEKLGPSGNDTINAFFADAEAKGILQPGPLNPFVASDHATRWAIDLLSTNGYWKSYLYRTALNLWDHTFDATPFFIFTSKSIAFAAEPARHPDFGMYTAWWTTFRIAFAALVAAGLVAGLLRKRYRRITLICLAMTGAFALASTPINFSRTALPELVLLFPIAAFGMRAIVGWASTGLGIVLGHDDKAGSAGTSGIAVRPSSPAASSRTNRIGV